MKMFKIIGFESKDQTEDSFYLHENDPDIDLYRNDTDWENIGIVGYTEETAEEFTGL